MKFRSKMVLGLSSLLLISAVAAGTSTYAWFTATRTATAGGEFTVNTNTDGLTVTAKDPSSALGSNTGSNNNIQYAISGEANYLTDVSGDGKTFYKASVSDDGSVVQSVRKINEDVTEAPYSYQVTLDFNHTNSAKTMALFLSSTSSITKVGAEGEKDISKAARIAIYNGETPVAYYAPAETGVANFQYFNGTTTSSKTTVKTGMFSDGTYDMNILDSAWKAADLNDVTAPEAGTISEQAGYLGTISTTETLSLTVITWIEGEDADCTNANLDSTFNVNLKFYGVNEFNA